MKRTTRRLHFISGLPRSGSTLLAAILRQNPRFSADMSSPLISVYIAAQMALSCKNEFHMFIRDDQRESILRGLFLAFYSEALTSGVVFDTSRLWCSKISELSRLFPECKVICCVRNIAWVIDSFERLVRVNALQPSRIFNFDHTSSVYTRADYLTGPGGLIRTAHDGLRDAFYGEHSDRLLLVEYESLARNPQDTMSSIYGFLGEDPFPHDFDCVEYEADEYDRVTGTPGLHHVRRKVEFVKRNTILPPDLFSKFDRHFSFWKDASSNIRNVRVI